MASLFQSRYTYFPEEVVLTLPSKYIFSGNSIVLHFLLPFLYKIEFFILPVCNITISCKFAKNSATMLYKRRIYGRRINNSNR